MPAIRETSAAKDPAANLGFVARPVDGIAAVSCRLTATGATATHLLDALVAELAFSAKGATPSQPGASPQGKSRKRI